MTPALEHFADRPYIGSYKDTLHRACVLPVSPETPLFIRDKDGSLGVSSPRLCLGSLKGEHTLEGGLRMRSSRGQGPQRSKGLTSDGPSAMVM